MDCPFCGAENIVAGAHRIPAALFQVGDTVWIGDDGHATSVRPTTPGRMIFPVGTRGASCPFMLVGNAVSTGVPVFCEDRGWADGNMVLLSSTCAVTHGGSGCV